MPLILVFRVLFGLHGFFADANLPAKSVVRSCPSSWNDAHHARKNASPSKTKPAPPKSGACVELDFSPLDIQEYLQAHSRNGNWSVTNDQSTEDTWTFSLELSKEDLLRYTLIDSRPKGIEWTAGSVRITINTLELTDGFVRTTVHAIFRGFGRNTDQFATHKEYWELASSNVLEDSVISALQSHFSKLSAASRSSDGQ